MSSSGEMYQNTFLVSNRKTCFVYRLLRVKVPELLSWIAPSVTSFLRFSTLKTNTKTEPHRKRNLEGWLQHVVSRIFPNAVWSECAKCKVFKHVRNMSWKLQSTQECKRRQLRLNKMVRWIWSRTKMKHHSIAWARNWRHSFCLVTPLIISDQTNRLHHLAFSSCFLNTEWERLLRSMLVSTLAPDSLIWQLRQKKEKRQEQTEWLAERQRWPGLEHGPFRKILWDV